MIPARPVMASIIATPVIMSPVPVVSLVAMVSSLIIASIRPPGVPRVEVPVRTVRSAILTAAALSASFSVPRVAVRH